MNYSNIKYQFQSLVFPILRNAQEVQLIYIYL